MWSHRGAADHIFCCLSNFFLICVFQINITAPPRLLAPFSFFSSSHFSEGTGLSYACSTLLWENLMFRTETCTVIRVYNFCFWLKFSFRFLCQNIHLLTLIILFSHNPSSFNHLHIHQLIHPSIAWRQKRKSSSTVQYMVSMLIMHLPRHSLFVCFLLFVLFNFYLHLILLQSSCQ